MNTTKIKIDTIGTPINKLTGDKLQSAGIPECFGSMIPPIILKNVSFNNTDIFAHKNSITDEELYDADVKSYITNYDESLNDIVITKKGVEIIETYKEAVATMYVSQLIKCSTCEYSDLCNQLTQNYLKALELNEIVR